MLYKILLGILSNLRPIPCTFSFKGTQNSQAGCLALFLPILYYFGFCFRIYQADRNLRVITPQTKDAVCVLFFQETKESLVDGKGATKRQLRKKCLCASDEDVVCDWATAFRNTDQLLEHLASPSSGLNRASGCKIVSVAARD